ncbi:MULTISPECIES: BKACE family enzyme [Mameliella]|uniref:3-keto-5-aminohexanoate cleavage protein n=1 Tax=Mameliella alba TaxID=561184 RepID=A0A0B3RJQ1_9RHOB|nr:MULTISPECIES: 3-keto-5-aminohexanoate cleavage protein [Mameliella]KHQ51460.1 3-keto-5-aminohexanoate cleavage protein [Mameliella alba]MDD9728607.1 3-keto-5-aminohexanoate cleavage protein [Mameliella sp. AT18]ODM50471.1 3-keto-5-aminohexanoate cleavage protein [Ruegeria sp. PBVC088]
MSKILITCAVTGSIHTPSMSPHLPVTADQITEHAVGAAEAGASILHLHARDPETGQPSADPAHFMGFLPRIKQATGAVLNISTGGSAVMTLDQRLAAPKLAEPEMCSLNMGSMNFALYPAAARIEDWKHDWEQPFLENSDDLVFKNTPRDIAGILQTMGKERGARFEFECYDLSHLYMLRHFVDRGMVEPPFFIQFVFGVLGGMGPDPENLTHMKTIADKLFGKDYMFSVLAAGRHQIPLTSMAAAMGGHVRVGLEDSLMIARGQLARTNAEQVVKIRRIVEDMGREVASPEDARRMLGLKGADRTAI